MANHFCTTISSSIGEIIRVSLDTEFRRECYKLMNATDTNDCEMKIHEKLLKIQENPKKRKPQKKRKANRESTGNENSLLQESGSKRISIDSLRNGQS